MINTAYCLEYARQRIGSRRRGVVIMAATLLLLLLLMLLLLLLPSPSARAQIVVHDPTLQASKIATHVAEMARLLEQLQTMQQQLQTAQQTLTQIDLLEQYMGNPAEVTEVLTVLRAGADYYDSLRSLPAEAAILAALAKIETYGQKPTDSPSGAETATTYSHAELYGTFSQQTHLAQPPANAYAAQATWEQQYRYSEQRLRVLEQERRHILADMEKLSRAIKTAATEDQRQDIQAEIEATKLAMQANGIEQQQLFLRLDALAQRNANEQARQNISEAELYWSQLERERQRRRESGFNLQDLTPERIR